uniref:TPPC8 C-terminal Ig-like domain-containing protein n=1 Tax=Phytophthora ramorum TaxID=164328 RepID=H3HCT9_PHYRM
MESMESWVQDTFAPVVLTSATSEAERIAQKNNLSIADLLNGFARLDDADTPLRSVTHPIQLARFNFRFLAASQFRPLGVNEATEQLNASIKRHPPRHDAASAVALDIPRIGADEDSNDPMPWYESFKHTLMDTFRCEEYSLLCHPVAMLIVVSSTDPNPRHSFEELTTPRTLPPPFQQGLYDATLVPKFFVVVHDVLETEGTSIDPDAILRSMNITTANGAVLRMNSLPVEDAPVPSQFASAWTENPYVKPPLFPDQLETFPQVSDGVGTLLSRDDVAQIKAFVRDFGLRFMLSSLEGRLFQLNESWLRKPKDFSRPSNNATSGGVTYKSDSIESQTRLLADTAFLVRDYELALQMYRLVRDDFKSDKSMFHCANVNEMIAICLLLTKGSPMQMTNALDSATAIYAKTPSPLTQRLAIRTAVIAGEIYHTLSKSGLFTDYMDNASAALIRGSTMEQGVCAAVLMERAALCDLRARLPKFRKYGFRMVMAGHANKLDDRMASINLFLKLIGTGRNSASQQEAMLYDFGLMVKDFLATERADASTSSFSRGGPILVKGGDGSATKLLVKDLCMPELDDKSTVVFASTNAFGIDRSIDGNHSGAETWQELKEVIDKQNRLHRYVTSANNDEARSWFAPSHLYAGYRNKRNTAIQNPENYVLGEQIYVEFVMKNALSCAVDVEDIHLFGKFETAGEDTATFDVPENRESGEQRILLPCSEERVRLAVCPKIRGKLSLTGVRWSICSGDVQALADLQVCCNDLLLCASGTGGAEVLCGYIGANGNVVDLSDVTLVPGETRQVTIWARGSVSGRRHAALLFEYKSAPSEGGGHTKSELSLENLAHPSSQHVTDVRDALHLGFFEARGGDGSGNDGKRGGGFRTIQSVRRENKALKSVAGEDGNDQKRQRDPQPTSRDALLSHLDTDGHLVLVWSTDFNSSYSEKVPGVAPHRAIGQANLTSVKIRQPAHESSCPLTVTLSYKDSVELRSSTYPGSTSGLSIAELDIMMQVCNDSAPSSTPLDVTVEMLHPEEAQASLPTSSPLTKLHSVSYSGASPPHGAPPRFFWTGATKKTVAQFLPNTRVTINLKACFVASGVYNLNRFRFIVQAAIPNQPAIAEAHAAIKRMYFCSMRRTSSSSESEGEHSGPSIENLMRGTQKL